ncbi:hypothetical protein N7471_010633 [Penicillium samsonianum]|uniref:uncharacterized protein n=1 Tax=Penicillium samsonianum TaxID=1882272 RepID=UPI002548B398|nr:uncharacterized protein N7471_010633 [Penicillium samsonianum]KAJ6126140.1 hypothetical protein N7471_010633 [Penicillium samsonianum]
MNLPSQSNSAEQTIRKGDIAKVSRSLQVRLGLAKLKYQHGQLHGLDFVQDECGKPSDSSDFSRSRCETRLTSPPFRSSTYYKELPLSVPNLSATRKRFRPDFDPPLPTKAAGVSWKRSCQLPKSSPRLNWYMGKPPKHTPFMSEAPFPRVSSAHSGAYAEESNPDILLHRFRNINSMANSSPPPLSKQARPPRELALNEDKTGLPLYLSSPSTPVCVLRGSQDLPCTPPFKHATLATLNSGLGSPGQQFNFADYVNVTPALAQPTWSSAIASI